MSRKTAHSRKNRYSNYVIIAVLLIITIILFTRCCYKPVVFRADNQRSGDFSQFNKLSTEIAWAKYQTYGYFISSPVINNGVLYVGETSSNALRSIDIRTGTLLWSFNAEDDIPFSPAITRDAVYITSSDGRLYALDKSSGKKRWEYRIDNFYSPATSPIAHNGTVYFGSRDSYFYAVNATSGKLRWKYHANGGIDGSPLIINSKALFGSFDGSFYAVSTRTGKEKWRFTTGGRIIGSPAEKNGIIFFGSGDGYVYAIHANTGKLVWKTQTNGPIETSPTVTSRGVIVANKKNTLYYLDRKGGSILWTKEFLPDAYTSAAVKNDMAYIGSSDGILYALRLKDGSEVWKFTTKAGIAAAPSIVGSTVFFTNRNGELYTIDRRSGLPYNRTINITQNSSSVGLYGIYELTVQHNSRGYQYPWLDASISAKFNNENNEVVVRGFYYDNNMWKVRFAPSDVGEWSWEVSLSLSKNVLTTKRGSFSVTPSDNEGFLRRNISDGRILQSDKGNIFHPLGIQTCIKDDNDDGFFLNSLYVDTNTVDLDTYLKTYGVQGAGFNIFRWGIENCTFRIWRFHEDPRQHHSFLTREGMWADTLMNKLKENGFHVWFTLFWDAPVARETNSATIKKYIHTIDPYLDYVIARYGAYVDVWELLNETDASKEWIEYVASYIRTNDPYQHLITTSWERPELSEIDIHAPHWYESNSLNKVDTILSQYIKYNDWGKPLVFGEFGNKGSNWDEDSLTRMRVQLWTSYFLGAGIIFWDSSGTKNYLNKVNANIYFGPEERTAIKAFRSFVEAIGTNMRPTQTAPAGSSVRSYTAASPSGMYGYLYHFTNQNTNISAHLLPRFPWKQGVITWINPQTGEIMAIGDLVSGVPITSPAFNIDLAYRIEEGNRLYK